MIATGGGRGANARLDIYVNTSGKFRIEASDLNSTGTYTLNVKKDFFRESVPELTDLDTPFGPNTYGFVEVSGPGATGDLKAIGDSNIFKVDLVQGQFYRVTVDDAPNGDPVCDPLVELRGPESQALTDSTYASHVLSDTGIAIGTMDRDSGSGGHPVPREATASSAEVSGTTGAPVQPTCRHENREL